MGQTALLINSYSANSTLPWPILDAKIQSSQRLLESMAWTPTNFIGWKQSLPRSSIVSAIASVVKIRAHLGVYVRGQLSDLPEKSVEPIALEASEFRVF